MKCGELEQSTTPTSPRTRARSKHQKKVQGKKEIMGKIIKVKNIIGKNNPEGKESYLERTLILVMTFWIHIQHWNVYSSSLLKTILLYMKNSCIKKNLRGVADYLESKHSNIIRYVVFKKYEKLSFLFILMKHLRAYD